MTFEGSLNVSYNTNLLTYVTIDVNTYMHLHTGLQYAYKLHNFYYNHEVYEVINLNSLLM